MNKLYSITAGLNRRFPEGDNPFQIVTRLVEECGELAQQVNHFEGAGIKLDKLGVPDKAHLAKEVMDVVRCALQVAVHYGVEAELDEAIERSYQKMKTEGLIR